MRLALIKEPGGKPVAIGCPGDIEQFVEPLKHYSDYVPGLNMCRRGRQSRLRMAEPVHCDT